MFLSFTAKHQILIVEKYIGENTDDDSCHIETPGSCICILSVQKNDFH